MKKMDFITKTVIYVFCFLTAFSVAFFISNHVNGFSQDALIQWIFTVYGLELLATMFKKYIDKKYGGGTYENKLETEIDK